MQIREAKVFSFGKLQQREYQFAPGINVVYGANEAGKSTLHTFLTAMLFGMEKSRGRSARDPYVRYEPWHAPSYYSGALRFVVGGRPFYLERNFYHREKRELLRNEVDGEELSVAYGDLTVLLGGIERETFENTCDIPQSGAAGGRELSGILSEYLSDAAEGGAGGIHVARAVDALSRRRKELQAELRKIQAQREQEEEALRMERRLLEQDCANLKREISAERLEWEAAEEKMALCVGNKERRNFYKAAAGFLIFGTFLNGLGYLTGAYQVFLFFCLECLLGAAVGIFFARGSRAAQKDRVEYSGHMELVQQQAKRMLARQNEALLEKETRLYNIEEQLADLGQGGVKEREIMEDIQALTLAAEEIERLSGEFCEAIQDELNGEVSRYVSAITGGKYDSARVDESGNLLVLAEGKEVAPAVLSRGTLEQFFLAFRLAVGTIVTREEKLPIFLDEAFCMYDDERLGQALLTLAGLGTQVCIFTCQRREMDLLDTLGIPYHTVYMEA